MTVVPALQVIPKWRDLTPVVTSTSAVAPERKEPNKLADSAALLMQPRLMHDTSLRLGRRFLEIYAVSSQTIVEVGSYDVNGGLRAFAPSQADYIGLDVTEGPGVDRVVVPGDPLPFADGSVDAILASSALEHDPAFWRTFDEMCRVTRPGGFVYLNVPSNGPVHRYPMDCWRFYPDAGLALEKSSKTGGWPVTLQESFVALREAHAWNDFVAVFQRDGGEPIGGRIHVFGGAETLYDLTDIKHTAVEHIPEDMRLLAHWRDTAGIERDKYDQARLEVEHWHALAVQQHHDLNRSQAELGAARAEIERLERMLAHQPLPQVPTNLRLVTT